MIKLFLLATTIAGCLAQLEPSIDADSPIIELAKENVISTTNVTLTTNSTETFEEADPYEHDLCIINPSSHAYSINEIWLDDCNQTCRCVFRKEPRNPIIDLRFLPTNNLKKLGKHTEQTEIRCNLSPKCGYVVPEDCQNHKLMFPSPMEMRTSCGCPTIMCLTPPPRSKFNIFAPVQICVWHVLVAISLMMFFSCTVCCCCLRKPFKVIAPINTQPAHIDEDDLSFTKLVSYQNYNNDDILAKQKNIEVDRSSPFYNLKSQIA